MPTYNPDIDVEAPALPTNFRTWPAPNRRQFFAQSFARTQLLAIIRHRIDSDRDGDRLYMDELAAVVDDYLVAP